MQGLFDTISGNSEVNQDLIREYFKRSERKKDDEKWIKEHRLLVIKELERLEKDIVDYDNIRVSMVIPDTSKFDEEKVLEFAESKGIKSQIVKEILAGLINANELTKYAWVESKGSPRVSLKELDRD